MAVSYQPTHFEPNTRVVPIGIRHDQVYELTLAGRMIGRAVVRPRPGGRGTPNLLIFELADDARVRILDEGTVTP